MSQPSFSAIVAKFFQIGRRFDQKKKIIGGLPLSVEPTAKLPRLGFLWAFARLRYEPGGGSWDESLSTSQWIYNFLSLSTNVALWQWPGLTDKLQRNQQRLLQTTLFLMPRTLEITFPSLLRLFFRHIFHNTTSGHLWKKLSKPLHCRQLFPHCKFGEPHLSKYLHRHFWCQEPTK